MLLNPPPFPEAEPVEKLPEKGFPVDVLTYEQNLKRTRCELVSAENTPEIVSWVRYVRLTISLTKPFMLKQDMPLNLTSADVASSQTLHVPWGQPQPTNRFGVSTLTSQNYVTG